MALTDEQKSDFLELLKTAAPGGMSKDDVTEMLNGLDKKWGKEQQKIAQTLESLGGFAKAFEGIKPKKLMKAMKKAGKGPKEPKAGEPPEPKPGEPKPGEGQVRDPYKFAKSKKVKKLEEAVEKLKVDNENEKKAAHEVKRVAEIKVLMSGLQWVKPEAQAVVFEKYKERVSLDPATNKLMFKLEDGDFAEFTKDFLTEDVSNRFDFALKPPEAGGSGISKGDGRKPGTLSLDDDLSTPEASTAFAKGLSKMLGHGQAA